ncbi:hypothetical protein F4779DRAFT_127831 [Xylariaceae sp. FL0662B]|nr:hypothetical protein F4779DRAFT_127831 [Xylariaceae sp. FL0662B]
MPDDTSTIPVGERKSKHQRKRYHNLDGQDISERRHKKSKSSSNPALTLRYEIPEAPTLEKQPDSANKKEHKKRKIPRKERNVLSQHQDGHQAIRPNDIPATESTVDPGHDKPIKADPQITTDFQLPEVREADHVAGAMRRKDKKSRERKVKREPAEADEAAPKDAAPSSRETPSAMTVQHQPRAPHSDFTNMDSTPAKVPNEQVFARKPDDQDFPFFTQTVSQYLPLFPFGLSEPLEGYADQHLKSLLNHYVPSFRGVLLAYRNPRIGEVPGKASLTDKSAREDVILLESINEYAANFSWLTVDVDLFRPARGAWMEGVVNLQGEGHIGVICWGKFNASIEAGRLPRGWRWVDLMSKGSKKTRVETRIPTPEPFEDQPEAEDGTQIHTTGYWVDETGMRLRGGTRLSFRIRNYEVGLSGDYGYLSIEGTMLDEEEEKAKFVEEMEDTRRRKLRGSSVSRRQHKRAPEFSLTKFGEIEEEGNEIPRAPIWMATRPESDSE